MALKREDILVSTEWLAERLDAPDVTIIDGSWYLPDMKRDAAAEYLERHIPGAIHLDIDAVSDRNSSLPHMLPPPDQFGRPASAMASASSSMTGPACSRPPACGGC